jgi:hypothetical protein
MGDHGIKIKAQLDELIAKGANIEFVYNPLTNVDFENAIASCDIILMPVNVETKFEGIPEIYGVTKATGVIFDSIRFQKPVLAPVSFQIPEKLKSGTISYHSTDHCVEILTELTQTPCKLTQLLRETKLNSDYYHLSNVQVRIRHHLESLLSQK